MKLNISATFFTLFLLSAIVTTISHLPSATADFILDTNDQVLQNGQSYYLLPVNYGAGGGGVTFAATGNETCPLSVVQSPLEYSRGSAVKISSPYRVLTISEGLSLEMSFRSLPECAPPYSQWTVVRGADDDHGKLSIKLSDTSEYDEDSRVSGLFHIKRNGRNGNKVVFCARDTDRCDDVAVRVDENGVRNLILGGSASANDKRNNPFIIEFQKARRHHHHDPYADDA